MGNQNPKVRLGYYGGVVTFKERDVTFVSPLGALVQMFQPFTLADAKQLVYGMYSVDHGQIRDRVADILGLTHDEYYRFLRAVYGRHAWTDIEIAHSIRRIVQ